MSDDLINSFVQTLDVLVDANPHARNKGDEFKTWCKDKFDCDARISFIKEQRQITNRVSEQFRYFAPVVVFVCVPEVKRETLIRYILERVYGQLENVAIIGTDNHDAKRSYKYEYLITFKQTKFTTWAKDYFDKVSTPNELANELGITIGTTESGDEFWADESERLTNGTNILLYGVPGCGKSWTIEHEYCNADSIVERLVFHPDYTNADFIGQILPAIDEDKQVTYEFSPGPFTTILRDAYRNPKGEYILIIEEINRGNAPAIFGETFQLLDRKVVMSSDDDGMPIGTSEYGITQKYMAKEIYGNAKRKVKIPSNLTIIGTMNTSDQNVFTLDTAFQRRWRMRLIENTFDNVRTSLAEAPILDTGVTWRKFCETINGIIIGNKAKMVSAEDKRLGVYFIHENDLTFDERSKPSKGFETLKEEYDDLIHHERENSASDDQRKRLEEIRAALMQNRRFPEKVIKYLWDDAFKFNPEALFDTANMDSLEKVIRTFVYSQGIDRFKVFTQSVRELLSSAK